MIDERNSWSYQNQTDSRISEFNEVTCAMIVSRATDMQLQNHRYARRKQA